MSDQVTVKTNKENGRTLFAGTEEDARAFVQNHFPRPHNEPGTDYGDDGPVPDVILSNGATFDGKNWSDANRQSETSVPRKAPAKKTTGVKAGSKR